MQVKIYQYNQACETENGPGCYPALTTTARGQMIAIVECPGQIINHPDYNVQLWDKDNTGNINKSYALRDLIAFANDGKHGCKIVG